MQKTLLLESEKCGRGGKKKRKVAEGESREIPKVTRI
jgi:hypothetical protein